MSGLRVLLAWELGGNLGHIARLLAIAKQIEAAGGEPVWALPANAMESPYLRHIEHRRIAVPPPIVVSDKVVPRSYAGILLNTGFGNPLGVAAAVRAWRAIYEQVQPDRVVLDTAPMAQLAARLFGWPAIRISNGFDSPPEHCPTFGLGMRGPYVEQLNSLHVERVKQSIAKVTNEVGEPDAPSPAQYLTYPKRYFDCIPETDCYGPRSDVHYVGPINGLPDLEAPEWPVAARQEAGFNVFAYLRSSEMSTALLGELVRAGASVLCAGSAGPPDMLMGGHERFRLAHKPVDVDAAMRIADLVVSYAPCGVTTIARLQGKPQLLAPNDLEKLLVATRLQKTAEAQIVIERANVRYALERARLLRTRKCALQGLNGGIDVLAKEMLINSLRPARAVHA